MPRFLAVFAAISTLVGVLSSSTAAAIKAPCPDVECVEKTVCVPTWVDEVRTIKETHYRKVPSERDVTKYRQVTVPKVLECKHTVFVPAKRPDVQTITIAKPVCRWVDEKYTVMVSHEEIRKGTRTICRPMPGCCDKFETIEVPYECKVVVCVPEERVRRKKVWETLHEEKTITREVCTIEAKVIVKPYTVNECVWQPVVVKEPYIACVPYTVEKQVTVRVCKMVTKTVLVPKCFP